jgi:tetratricopeptide (TPR) repeat protein
MIYRSYRFSLLLLIVVIASTSPALAQAPPAIQLFMPGGRLPERSIRFTLVRDDGRIETLFTDTKGKFQITGDLIREADYTIRVEGDGRTFGSTVATFRIIRATPVYVPVFLNDLETKVTRAGVIDVADANVPANARAAHGVAMQAVEKGNAEEAIAGLKKAISLYPQYLRALNDLGVMYLKLNRLEEAAETFRQAIKIDQTFIHPRLNLGIVLNRQGKYAEAVTFLGKVYKENPQLTGVSLPYAEALAAIGQLPAAEKVLREFLGDKTLKSSTEAEARFRLGAVMNRENRFVEAAAEFEKSISLEPKAAMAHLQFGGALIELKRLPEAEKALLKAYELGGPSAGGAQFLLGQLYYLQVKYNSALLAFEQYLKDVPNAPNVAQVKDAMDKIRSALNKKDN